MPDPSVSRTERRTIEGPCFLIGNRSIEVTATDDPGQLGFIYSKDVWFIPPGATAEVTVGADDDHTLRGRA